MIFILGHLIDLSIFVTRLLSHICTLEFFMDDNGRFLLNLMRRFDTLVPRHVLYFIWFLVMDYVQELFWKQSWAVCQWCAGEYSLLSPVGFHYSLDLKKGDPSGLPPDCWDLVVLTLTSVSLKRPNEKKSLLKELLFKHSSHLITPLLPFSYLCFSSGFLWKWEFNLFFFTQPPYKLK